MFSFILPYSWYISFSWLLSINSQYHSWNIYVFVNWTVDTQLWDFLSWAQSKSFDKHSSIFYPAWSLIEVKMTCNQANIILYAEQLKFKETYNKSSNNTECTPKIIKQLWDFITCFTYWIDTDWVFKWWIINGESTTATAWNITLWNAVWFLEINYNWEIVKVPYYL